MILPPLSLPVQLAKALASRTLEVPAELVASLCFPGPDRRDLHVVTGDNGHDRSLRGSIFRTRIEVAGLPAPDARI